jgi:uncharacterized protein YodC (DUF2158 family)
MKFKLNDKVCLVGSGNYPKMEIMAVAENGIYRCAGTNHRLTSKKKHIDQYFKEEELEYWVDHSEVIYLRDKNTFR